MKTIDSIGCQGDLLFIRVEKLPEGLTIDPARAPTLAHSESGHHHKAIAARGFEVERWIQDPLIAYVRIRRKREAIIAQADSSMKKIDGALGAFSRHEKTGQDAHEDLGLRCEGDEAIYRVHRQQELRPSGWTLVQD
jgi:hypothetical protein